jgi:hypothetical protein
MPSYAKVLTETYLPAQAAKLRWESAKTVAGAQFDALAEQRRAIEEIRYRRQQYADNIAATDGSTDALMFQALQTLSGTQAQPGAGVGRGVSKAVADSLAAVKRLPVGQEQFTSGSAPTLAVQNALKSARSIEQFEAAKAAAESKGYSAAIVRPSGLVSEAALQAKAARGDAAAKTQLDRIRAGAVAQIDLADNSGSRAFQGGLKGREFFEGLSEEQQELSRTYASALLDDGVVTEDEIPEGQLEAARKLHGEIEAKGAYRLQDKAAFNRGYLDLLKNLSADEARLKETEARLKGKTKETLAEELYTGATERAAIPPLLRSLEPEMKKYLDGFAEAQAADAKTDPESYLRSKMTDREAKGFSAASAMAASGMRAAEIMDSLQALSPAERRSVMGALASRDAIASTQMKVAPGTPLPEIQKIQTEDRRAQEAELARTESRLQARLRELDESLAPGRDTGFGGLVSPDTGARPRRDVLMGALSPEQQLRMDDAAEVDRIATERADRLRAADEGLETPEETAAVEEFRRRRASGQGMGLTREQLLANISEEPRMDFERRRLQAREGGKSSPVPVDLPATPQGRVFTPVDLAEPAPTPAAPPAPVEEPVEITPEPLPKLPPDKVFKRVYNPATGEIELIEVK